MYGAIKKLSPKDLKVSYGSFYEETQPQSFQKRLLRAKNKLICKTNLIGAPRVIKVEIEPLLEAYLNFTIIKRTFPTNQLFWKIVF
jgi:hypothetical protein